MTFRTQIFSFFFLFAVAPLLTAVVINLPLVLDRTELFHRKAHLQNLRADFRDLDQHLASRQEMVRLLAKLPEPGAVLGDTDQQSADDIDLARARYTAWINRIFQDQRDIIQITFLNEAGQERFWLARDPENQGWQPTRRLPDRPPAGFFEAGMGLRHGGVLVSPISINREAGAEDPRRLMTLRLISPVRAEAESDPVGAVVLHVDVGDMAGAYRDTYWVYHNGVFLSPGGEAAPRGDAFARFAGLREIFAEAKPALWQDDGQQVMWVPLFRTEQSGPLWVGRRVDPLPMAQFRNALVVRVLFIILLLVIVIWLAARWIARRTERISQELTDGIRQVLEEAGPIDFHWRGPQELKALGRNLSELAERHYSNTRNLRKHARELEESNRYKSQFLANVSHELRTPLNSILLLSKMLSERENGLSDERREQAAVIHAAGRDLHSLIDNILDLSRIEAQQTAFLLEEIDLPRLLRELAHLVQPQFDAKGLPLVLALPTRARCRIQSDPDKVRQIIKNFLSNAVKFTAGGQVTLRLECDRLGRESACPVRIAVEDTGIGIPEAKQGRIFEAFRQADGSTSRRYGGTGLGLAISQQLAQLLGGRIEVSSEPGAGAVFTLGLPREPDRARLAQEQQLIGPEEETLEEVEAPDPPDSRLQGLSLLLVDEDVNDLLSLAPLLERWGIRVNAAGDLEEALETLEDEDIRLVLVDTRVPNGGGCDTIEKIKAQKQFEALPIVALCGEESEAQPPPRVDDCVRRPIDPALLKEVLVRCLTGPVDL